MARASFSSCSMLRMKLMLAPFSGIRSASDGLTSLNAGEKCLSIDTKYDSGELSLRVIICKFHSPFMSGSSKA